MGNLIHICSGIGVDAVSVLHPPGVLVSAAAVLETANSHRKVIKFIKASQAKNIFLDNGMYTFFKLWQNGEMVSYDCTEAVHPKGSKAAINLTSRHTITAALKLSPYIDTMIANDLPVRKSSDPGEQEFLFRNVMYFNLKAAEEMVAFRDRYCPGISVLYAIQAYTPDQLMVVMHEIRDLEFDGFSLPIRPYRWNQLLAMLIMLHHLKVRRVHILGSANVSTLAVAAFAAQHLFEEVSWDASSFHKYSIYLYYQLKDLTAVSISRRKLLPKEWVNYRCDCPACNGKRLLEIRNISDVKVKTLCANISETLPTQ